MKSVKEGRNLFSFFYFPIESYWQKKIINLTQNITCSIILIFLRSNLIQDTMKDLLVKINAEIETFKVESESLTERIKAGCKSS
jgi:hypothetical protein